MSPDSAPVCQMDGQTGDRAESVCTVFHLVSDSFCEATGNRRSADDCYHNTTINMCFLPENVHVSSGIGCGSTPCP